MMLLKVLRRRNRAETGETHQKFKVSTSIKKNLEGKKEPGSPPLVNFSDKNNTFVNSLKVENNTRVLPGLDSPHGKCSYQQAKIPFYRQWCYLSASVQLLLPTQPRWEKW